MVPKEDKAQRDLLKGLYIRFSNMRIISSFPFYVQAQNSIFPFYDTSFFIKIFGIIVPAALIAF